MLLILTHLTNYQKAGSVYEKASLPTLILWCIFFIERGQNSMWTLMPRFAQRVHDVNWIGSQFNSRTHLVT